MTMMICGGLRMGCRRLGHGLGRYMSWTIKLRVFCMNQVATNTSHESICWGGAEVPDHSVGQARQVCTCDEAAECVLTVVGQFFGWRRQLQIKNAEQALSFRV